MLFVLPHTGLRLQLHPLGVAKLSAVLRDVGIKSEILDLSASKCSMEDLTRKLQAFQPDIVGISYRTTSIPQAREISDCVKSYDTDIKVIVGGADVTARKVDAVCDVNADLGVVGEGEDVIKIIAERPNDNLSDVKGLVIKDGDELKFTGERPLIKNLDAYPFTAYDLLDLDIYKKYPINLARDFLTMVTSRGCPFQCAFCYNSMFGRIWRSNSAEYIVDEIEHCQQTLPLKLKSILFVDDSFTVNKKHIYELCNLIEQRGFDLTLKFETRVDLVNYDLLKRMSEVGFKRVSYGVESGNNVILKEWCKGITTQQVRKAFKISKKLGYCTTAYMIIGAMSETPKTIQDSIDLIKDIEPDFTQWSLAAPLPGTKLTELFTKEFGEISDWSGIYYSKAYGQQSALEYRTKYMTNDELQEWFRKAYHDTYFNFKYILRRLRRMTNFPEIRTTINGIREMLNATS